MKRTSSSRPFGLHLLCFLLLVFLCEQSTTYAFLVQNNGRHLPTVRGGTRSRWNGRSVRSHCRPSRPLSTRAPVTISTTTTTQQQLSVRSLQEPVSKSAAWVKRAVQKVMSWQQAKRRSLFVAAAMALALVLNTDSSMMLARYPHNLQSQQQPEMSRLVKVAQPPRGGSSISSFFKSSAASSNKETSFKKMERQFEEAAETVGTQTGKTIGEAFVDLGNYMQGPKSDTLLLLLATALITPVCKKLGTSPILGFLASGMLLGPNGCGLISGIHTTETLAELGIVFFLFEMGIELSFDRLLSMKKDVFGLGLSQFLVTALGVALIGQLVGLPANANVVLGGGLALSSSAFVLQLLKDKNQLATRFGKAAFGVLLFQDLAVVPLLVVTPILAGGGSGLARALGSAVIKAGMALGSIGMIGRFLLNPMFRVVAQAQSQEAFLGVILLTVLSMSFMTEGLGLSNTLGAFLAGVLLSETRYRYQIEADIAPFRGMFLSCFYSSLLITWFSHTFQAYSLVYFS